MPRTGRRSGDPDTRSEILAAARRQFTASGYARATVRAIAADAGVDPALVHHYFGTKADLLVAALDVPVNPADLLAGLIEQGLDGLGPRIIETMVTVWDAADVNPMLMFVRSLSEDDQTVHLWREFITTNVLGPLAKAIDVPDPELRAALAGSQFIGLLIVRYVARIEPLASLPPAEVAAIVGPNVQRYLVDTRAGSG